MAGIMNSIKKGAAGMLGEGFSTATAIGGIAGAGLGLSAIGHVSDGLTGNDGAGIGSVFTGAATGVVGIGAVMGGSAIALRHGGKYSKSILSGLGATATMGMGAAAVGGTVLGARLTADGLTGHRKDDGSRAGAGSLLMGAGLLGATPALAMYGARKGMFKHASLTGTGAGSILNANSRINDWAFDASEQAEKVVNSAKAKAANRL